MKVFISQPMRGKSDKEILSERKHMIKKVNEIATEKPEIIDSFFQDAPTEANPLWFLGESLKLLSKADIAVFAKDWQDARGCRIEHECCVQYGIKIIEM